MMFAVYFIYRAGIGVENAFALLKNMSVFSAVMLPVLFSYTKG
jgi:hypothetical protein